MWSLLTALFLAGSAGASSDLTLSSCSYKLDPERAREVQATYAAAVGIPSLEHPRGLLGALNIDPGRAPQIVLVSFNNFFGDSLIFHFSLIDYFAKKYPGVPLTVISPKAQALSASREFTAETLPVRFTEYARRSDRDEQIHLFRERMPRFLKDQIRPGAFVLFDLTTLDKSGMEIDPKNTSPELRPESEFVRVMHELQATAVGLSNLHKGYIMLGATGLKVLAPDEKFPAALASSPSANLLRTRSGHVAGVALNQVVSFGTQNVYDSWLQNLSLLFGPDFYLHFDARFFVQDGDAVRARAFLEQAGLNPDRPYVLLNLNTFGRDKVRHLTPLYMSLYFDLIRAALKQNVQVVATFPEGQFGPEIQESILAQAQEWRGQVALLPASQRELQPILLAQAKAVLSYDSGLVHMAAFLPPERVLAISLTSGMADTWTRPGQAFLKQAEGQSYEDYRQNLVRAWSEMIARETSK